MKFFNSTQDYYDTYPSNIRTIKVEDVTVEDYYLLEADDAFVCEPSAMINGKIVATDSEMEFLSYEEAQTYGALLLTTGQAKFFTVHKYTRLF